MMKFGERLKQLRLQQELTQPELAEKVGMEQSYLSKLENDKSIPSAEMFEAILSIFAISLDDFLSKLSPVGVNALKSIPAVHAWQFHRQQMQQGNRTKWLQRYAIACVIGLTCVLAGANQLVFDNIIYQYMSPGVVKPGESKEIFNNWRDRFVAKKMEYAFTHGGRDAELIKQQTHTELEMINRRDEYYMVSNTYRGDTYNISIAQQGSRTFHLLGSKDIRHIGNNALILLGILALLAGVFGYFSDWRSQQNLPH
ncbi:helix-turn-helix domain-containing protein [Neptunicella sp. SCSIO 80796]|uniref:helix-turn-helix domain-containing protein n=1 Tax=Neptunicella plasticusilytica TaxID=3117012 RepID=UPI003A4D50A6